MRLVQEAREQDPELSMNAAVVRIGQRTGVNADTLRGWCKQADVDAAVGRGRRPVMRSGSMSWSGRTVS
jgi:transposase-like protein